MKLLIGIVAFVVGWIVGGVIGALFVIAGLGIIAMFVFPPIAAIAMAIYVVRDYGRRHPVPSS